MAEESPGETVGDEGTEDPHEEATRLLGEPGLLTGQLLYAGVTLGMFDLFEDERLAADDVAAELDLHSETTYRVLRALAQFGLVSEKPDNSFTVTPVGECFQADHPKSLQASVRFNQSPEVVRATLRLPELLEEGDPAGFDRAFGDGIFEYGETHPGFGDALNEYMSARSRWETDLVLETLEPYDWSRFSRVCDVGGGHGHLLSHVLARHTHLEGVVLDLPGVVSEEDKQWAPEVGVAERCDYRAGDMFDAVPEADAYFLKSILHDWGEDACVDVLSNIHEASPPDARLFVVEAVVPGPGTEHYAKQLDVWMLVLTGGRERTEAEHTALLDRSDWEHVETWVPDAGPISILEAKKC